MLDFLQVSSVRDVPQLFWVSVLKKTDLTVQRTNVNREYSAHVRECLLAVGRSDLKFRAWSHGGGEPWVVEVPRLSVVKKSQFSYGKNGKVYNGIRDP